MNERRMRFVGFGLTIAVIVAAVGILNMGAAVPQASECPSGGGGGGSGSPSPTGGSPSGSGGASPSGSSAGAPVDQLPLAAQSSSGGASPSGSSSSSGGGLPTNLTSILPGGDDTTASPSGSPSSPPGGGSEAKCATKLTIKYVRVSNRTSDPRDHFAGAVKSPNSDCEKGRDVVLKKVKGDRAKTVGRTVSAKTGKWKIRGVKPKGKFYAESKARPTGDVICKKGKSKTISP